MKYLIILALLPSIGFADNFEPPKEEPIKVDIDNTNVSINDNDLRQGQGQSQGQQQGQNQGQHQDATAISGSQSDSSSSSNSQSSSDSRSSSDSSSVSNNSNQNTASNGDQITEVTVSPSTQVNNNQRYHNSYISRQRIQHVAPPATSNRIGNVTRATNSLIITGGYDEVEGNSVNVGVLIPFGGGGRSADRAMRLEADYMEARNRHQREQHIMETIEFCAAIQKQIKITPEMPELWKRCGDYLIEPEKPKVEIKYVPVEGHHHKENEKGYMEYNGKVYINRDKAYDPNWENPCEEVKEEK